MVPFSETPKKVRCHVILEQYVLLPWLLNTFVLLFVSPRTSDRIPKVNSIMYDYYRVFE